MATPTIIHERREVYRGRIFSLSVDRVTLPSGHTSSMDIVRHPGSVVLLPMPAPDRIVLIRQYRYAELRGAARECEEEIGLVPGRLELLGRLLPTPGFCDETMAFYRCLDLTAPSAESTVRPDDDEVIEPQTFALADVKAMIARGEITDMKTVAGLALLA
jgi:ADP-ribose pyrophosphatase